MAGPLDLAFSEVVLNFDSFTGLVIPSSWDYEFGLRDGYVAWWPKKLP